MSLEGQSQLSSKGYDKQQKILTTEQISCHSYLQEGQGDL